jgi:hypothetical protein
MPRSPLRWLSVHYAPRPDERPFMDRAETRERAGLEVTASVLSAHESRRFFGVNMARRGIQPLWVRIANGTDRTLWLDPFSIDSAYYTPLEAAYVSHFAVGKRLLSLGALAFLFLPLLPIALFKALGARSANRRMNAFFRAHGFRGGPIGAGEARSGFVFCTLDEGVKNVTLEILGAHQPQTFAFMFDVPGLVLGPTSPAEAEPAPLEDLEEDALRRFLEEEPPATTNRGGSKHGDPLNLIVVGNDETLTECFGSNWDQVEAITFKTCSKMAKAFLLDAEYRYSPVSPLYFGGRPQDLALQRARANINERIHLRLWRTAHAFEGQQVWIGQVSRDIGVRFTFKTWNLTTHKIDPDVDESRDYVMACLMADRRVSRLGYCGGVGPTPESSPRHNLTGDPYFTDGRRAVVLLSSKPTDASFLGWAGLAT